jgi:hypothetical protein
MNKAVLLCQKCGHHNIGNFKCYNCNTLLRLLTDDECEDIIDSATASYRRHMMSVRGQRVTVADDPQHHLIRATEQFIRNKLD